MNSSICSCPSVSTAAKIKTLNFADHDELNAELVKLSRILNRRADMLGIVHDEKFRNLFVARRSLDDDFQ